MNTPGPWAVEPSPDPCPACDPDGITLWRIKRGDQLVAEVMACGGPTVGDDEANARLIAAAPDLLEAAQGLTVIARSPDGEVIIGPQGWANLRAAIARATGQEVP